MKIDSYPRLILNELIYTSQFNVLNGISTLCGYPLRNKSLARKVRSSILSEVWRVTKLDSKRFNKGIYPKDLKPRFNLIKNLQSFSRVLADYPNVIAKRKKNDTKIKSDHKLPDYYKRSFHFQTDGYLTKKSAELYDHQVEILFGGLAGTMRRSLVFALKSLNFRTVGQYHALELGAGTGRGSYIFKKSFSESSVTVTDISDAYLEQSRLTLEGIEKIKFQTCQGEDLPFEQDSFDISFQIFLLHEVPFQIRKKIIEEQLRVTKPKGVSLIIESLQLNDKKEWNEVLKDFPKRYHEPYYNDYIKHPLKEMIENSGGEIVFEEKILFSKCLVIKKKTESK